MKRFAKSSGALSDLNALIATAWQPPALAQNLPPAAKKRG